MNSGWLNKSGSSHDNIENCNPKSAADRHGMEKITLIKWCPFGTLSCGKSPELAAKMVESDGESP